MAPAAFGRAVLTAGGTFLALGAATMAVSSVSMGVAKVVVKQHKNRHAVQCAVCSGKTKMECSVCRGDRVIKYHPVKTLPSGLATQWCGCAMCGATGVQKCLNCLGEGVVLPP